MMAHDCDGEKVMQANHVFISLKNLSIAWVKLVQVVELLLIEHPR